MTIPPEDQQPDNNLGMRGKSFAIACYTTTIIKLQIALMNLKFNHLSLDILTEENTGWAKSRFTDITNQVSILRLDRKS